MAAAASAVCVCVPLCSPTGKRFLSAAVYKTRKNEPLFGDGRKVFDQTMVGLKKTTAARCTMVDPCHRSSSSRRSKYVPIFQKHQKHLRYLRQYEPVSDVRCIRSRTKASASGPSVTRRPQPVWTESLSVSVNTRN